LRIKSRLEDRPSPAPILWVTMRAASADVFERKLN
jgi:hypothetical protein